jgi:ubiquinone/menaquinone biosynthesis C-methylase UbiE
MNSKGPGILLKKQLTRERKQIFKNGLFWADKEIYYVFASQEIWNFSQEKLRNSQKVIDLGCGVGTLLHNLSKESKGEVCGLDLSREKCMYAKKMAPNSNVVRADVLRTPFKEKVFGMVFSSQLIEHVDDVKMIAEINRILKDNGFLTLGTIYREGSIYPANPEHLREYTSAKQLTDPLIKFGFIKIRAKINPVKYSPLDKVFRILYKIYPSSILIELPKHRILVFLRKLTRIRMPTLYHLELIAQENTAPNS